MMAQERIPLFDAVKAVGCLAIVLHHLAIYGPMSEVVAIDDPQVIASLVRYGRLAVYVFFVIAGYFVAEKLPFHSSMTFTRLLKLRYKRLASPLLFAVVFAALITSIVRYWFHHKSLSGPPTVSQFIAHGLLLQDIFGVEALSAGVWYVSIDFQLFASIVLIAILTRYTAVKSEVLLAIYVIGIAACSLWYFDQHVEYQDDMRYFFGCYALGILAHWTLSSSQRFRYFVIMMVLGVVSLLLNFQPFVFVAFITAILISTAGQKRSDTLQLPLSGALSWLGQRSYSIFLIHYSFCILVNAVWSVLFPTGLWANLIGIGIAVLASIWAGSLLYDLVERNENIWHDNRYVFLLLLAIFATLILERSHVS